MAHKEQIRSENPPIYSAIQHAGLAGVSTDTLIAELRRRLPAEYGELITSPDAARAYLQAHVAATTAHLEHEVFGAVWLSTRHTVIADYVLFRGTLDSASVYPREVVKAALAHNAAACMLYHNHPSGNAEPSQADRMLTRKLTEALDLVGVRVLDHFVVGRDTVTSFAEKGLL